MAFVLPRLVTFRGDNGRLLRTFVEDIGMGVLRFEAADNFVGEGIMHEVIQDGTFVLFVSKINGQYWKVGTHASNVIAAAPPIMFWQMLPNARFTITHLGSNVVALRAADNNLFAKRVTSQRQEQLRAVDASVSQFSRLIVGEPVAERELENIQYNLDEARIYDNKLVILGENGATNNSSFPADVQLGVSYQLDTTTNWNNSITVGISTTMSFFAGAPRMEGGRLQVTLSTEHTREWGESRTESTTISSTFTIRDVSPGSAVRLTVRGSEAKYDVPFSYTQKDILINGDRSTEDRTDGLFKGVNAFNVEYEAVDQRGHTYTVELQ